MLLWEITLEMLLIKVSEHIVNKLKIFSLHQSIFLHCHLNFIFCVPLEYFIIF